MYHCLTFYLYNFAAQYHFVMIVQALCETKEEVSIVSAVDYTDAVHNFILSQKLPLLLGKFPEVKIYIFTYFSVCKN